MEIEELKKRLNLEEHTRSLAELLLDSLERLKRLISNQEEPPLDLKKEIYRLLINKIIVYPDYTAKVIYRFKPNNSPAVDSRLRFSTFLYPF